MSNLNNLNVQLAKLSQQLVTLQHEAKAQEDLYWSADDSDAPDLYNIWQDTLDSIDDLEGEIEDIEREIEAIEAEHDERDEI